MIHALVMPADGVVAAQLQCVVHALGEVDLIGGWVEVALDARHGTQLGEDYQVLVTSYEGVALFVQNRTRDRFEIHALSERGGKPRRPTRCSYCVLGWAPRTAALEQSSNCVTRRSS